MTDQLNPQQAGFDPTRRLKKVKKPVRRVVPGQPAVPGTQMPQAPAQSQNYNPQPAQQPQESSFMDDFNIDDILDDNSSLPALNNSNDLYENDDNNYEPQFINDSDIAQPKVPLLEQLMQGNMFTIKGAVLIGVLALIIGFMFARLFFTQQTVVRDGLQGVVINAEVPRGRARCGVAERTQGCVLYIMNPQRQELSGRDFYDLASQLTGRQRFVIETGNMRYSSVKIRPGDIAQLNIPPLQ